MQWTEIGDPFVYFSNAAACLASFGKGMIARAGFVIARLCGEFGRERLYNSEGVGNGRRG